MGKSNFERKKIIEFMEKIHEQVVALLIVSRGDSFSNSYGLCKVLTRKFNVDDCFEIVNLLMNNKYVTSLEKNGFMHFTITDYGYDFLNKNRSGTTDFLIKEFPHEVDIIKALSGIK